MSLETLKRKKKQQPTNPALHLGSAWFEWTPPPWLKWFSLNVSWSAWFIAPASQRELIWIHFHQPLPPLVHRQRHGSSASLGTEPQTKTPPLAHVPPSVLALGSIFVVTYWDFEIVKRSPETNAIREAVKVIKSLREIHAFLMETVCFDGICMLF